LSRRSPRLLVTVKKLTTHSLSSIVRLVQLNIEDTSSDSVSQVLLAGLRRNMPFLAKQSVPIPGKDILSWMFDEPRFDQEKAVSPSVSDH
jgi:hypothetical protein